MNPLEIILILAVALIVLGPERLPEVMRVIGKLLRELRLASNTVLREMSDVLDDEPSRTAPPSAVTRSLPPESTPERRPPEKT